MAIYNSALFEANEKLLRGNLQLIACAGSGKTDFVSERIAFMLHKGIAKPSEIVAFTFTEKAAEELKTRIRQKITELMGKQPDIGDMYIGTIHAFAFHLLQEYIPRYRAFDMLDEVSRLAFLASIRKDINEPELYDELNSRFKWSYYRHGTRQRWTYRTFLRDADIVREEGLTPADLISEHFRNGYLAYLQKMEERRFLDFSGILRIAVDTLKNDEKVRNNVRSQYRFFTVDEYQDTNPIQEELVQLLSSMQNVCVVGDDDQSIYQWRGANVNNIITFTQRYPGAVTHELDTNRRSHDSIVTTAREFIKDNTPRLKKNIFDSGKKSEAGDLFKIVFERQEYEIEWIVNRIKQLHGTAWEEKPGQFRKLMYSDMGMLFRSIAREGDPYITALKDAGIPVIYTGTGGLFHTTEVTGIIQLLEYIGETDAKTSYDDSFLQNVFTLLHPVFGGTFLQLKTAVDSLKNWAKNLKRLSIQKVYHELLAALGLAGATHHDIAPEDQVLLYNLGRLSQAIADFESSREYLTYRSINSFIWFIRLHAEDAYDSGNTDAMAGLVDAVQVMTMHGSKGLGFPVVFLPCHLRRNSERNFGPTHINTDQVDLTRYVNSPADERRLYYVAITRAKKFLFLTTAQYKIDGVKKSPHDSLFDEIPPARFITTALDDPTPRPACDEQGVSEDVLLPTSYSTLAYYLNCAYDYKMRFVYGFNPQLAEEMGFGKQIHNVINLLHKSYEQTQTIPGVQQLDDLLAEHFYLRHAPPVLKSRLRITALKSLKKYLDKWKADFSLVVKTERPFEFEFQQALISGAIDMLKRENDTGSSLEVIDFKTGKADNDLMHRYELQVQLYTIAAREALGINTQKAQIHFIDTDKNERLAIDTSDAALEVAREELTYAIEGISKTRFNRDARQDKICGDCDWNKMCPKRKGFRG